MCLGADNDFNVLHGIFHKPHIREISFFHSVPAYIAQILPEHLAAGNSITKLQFFKQKNIEIPSPLKIYGAVEKIEREKSQSRSIKYYFDNRNAI